MRPPRVLLFAATTGYQTRAFAEAGRSLGYEVVLATDRCDTLDDPWGDQAVPVKFEDVQRSLKHLRTAGRFDAAVAIGDRPAVLAARVAAEIGYPYSPASAVEACHDKYAARELFRRAGLPVPAYFREPLDADPEEAAARAVYPCVLKPLGLSASRGVIRANHAGEFAAAFVRIRLLLETRDIRRIREPQNDFIQVEEYIPGREFAIEGLVTGGVLHPLAVFEKPDPLEGPFFEESLYVTPAREPESVLRELAAAAQQAIGALGLTRGPVHAELRYNSRGAWVLEVAARPIGGLCARALRFNGGVPLEEVILRHAAGEDVSGAQLDGPACGVMMIPIPRAGIYEGVSGVEQAGALPGVEEVIITAKEGQRMLPLPEGASYLGFIFARASTAAAVEEALRKAHSRLQFRMAAILPVLAQPLERGGTKSGGSAAPSPKK